jgi:hypothetical protein
VTAGGSPHPPPHGNSAAPVADEHRWPTRRRAGGPVWFLLAPGCFATKPQLMSVGFPWISLDSLVRNETYQWVTRGKRGKFFLGAFWRFEAPNLAAALDGMRKDRIAHGASLVAFRFFCNRLSSEPYPFGRPSHRHPRQRVFEWALRRFAAGWRRPAIVHRTRRVELRLVDVLDPRCAPAQRRHDGLSRRR